MTTLNRLADMLQDTDPKLPVVFGGDIYQAYVRRDGEGSSLLVPTGFSSYRGYYKNPAVVPAYMPENLWPTVEAFRRVVNATPGDVFTGWKGGEYTMQGDDALFVAKEGDSTSIGLFDVVTANNRAILVTYDVSTYEFI